MDMPIAENVGAESTSVNQRAQHTPRRQTLQVRARLAEPLPQTLDIAHSKPPTDKVIEVDPAGDQVATSVGVAESTATRKRELVEDLGLDERQVIATPATSHRREGPRS